MIGKLSIMPLDKDRRERQDQIVPYLKQALEKAEKGELSSLILYFEDWEGHYEIHQSGCENSAQTIGNLFQCAVLRMRAL